MKANKRLTHCMQFPHRTVDNEKKNKLCFRYRAKCIVLIKQNFHFSTLCIPRLTTNLTVTPLEVARFCSVE